MLRTVFVHTDFPFADSPLQALVACRGELLFARRDAQVIRSGSTYATGGETFCLNLYFLISIGKSKGPSVAVRVCVCPFFGPGIKGL